MSRVTTVGEIMMRLQPHGYKRIMQAESLDIVFGGGEANVAVSLSQFGEDVRYITKLPSNVLGDKCIRELKSWGVDTTYIARGGDRLGLYFCEKGCSQRPSNVIYDRAESSFSTSSAKDYDLDKALDGVEWLHWTGITPAVSKGVADLMREILKKAKEKGITISCDINYRKKLWTRQQANDCMNKLVRFVDVLISNEEDCKDVFDIEAEGCDINAGEIEVCGYEQIGRKLMAKFPNLKCIAFTLRESISASRNNWSGVLVEKKDSYVSKKYEIDLVDRIGGGDSFAAGLIYSMLNGYNNLDAINFAVAASCLKQTIEGDFNISSVEEVKRLAGGNGNGRVQR